MKIDELIKEIQDLKEKERQLEYLKHIEEVAKKQGKTIKDFILEAIKDKIEKWEKGE